MRIRLLFVGLLIFAVALLSGCSPNVAADPGPEVPAAPSAREVDVELHLPSPDGGWLESIVESVEVRGEAMESVVLDLWLDRVGGLPTGVSAGAEHRGDIIYVSFGNAIHDVDLEDEPILVKSLVSTMVEIEGARMVQILVEGKKVETLAGNSLVSEPLGRDDSVLATDEFVPMEPADPREGEVFVYGEIIETSSDGAWIEIDQHIADARDEVIDPRVHLRGDVVVQVQKIDDDGEAEYSMMDPTDLGPGMVVGIIIGDGGEARGVIVELR